MNKKCCYQSDNRLGTRKPDPQGNFRKKEKVAPGMNRERPYVREENVSAVDSQ